MSGTVTIKDFGPKSREIIGKFFDLTNFSSYEELYYMYHKEEQCIVGSSHSDVKRVFRSLPEFLGTDLPRVCIDLNGECTGEILNVNTVRIGAQEIPIHKIQELSRLIDEYLRNNACIPHTMP